MFNFSACRWVVCSRLTCALGIGCCTAVTCIFLPLGAMCLRQVDQRSQGWKVHTRDAELGECVLAALLATVENNYLEDGYG